MKKDTQNNPQVLGYNIIGIINFSDSTQTFSVNLNKLSGNYKEFPANDLVELGSNETLELGAWGYKVYYKN